MTIPSVRWTKTDIPRPDSARNALDKALRDRSVVGLKGLHSIDASVSQSSSSPITFLAEVVFHLSGHEFRVQEEDKRLEMAIKKAVRKGVALAREGQKRWRASREHSTNRKGKNEE
ncbi:hypothetical protein H8D30_07105 [bacterium]|nr:hypothetical protein [bacterium]